MFSREMSPLEAAELIERFLGGCSLYPQEWNDFVEIRQKRPETEFIRKRCDELDPLVNRPDPVDAEAVEQLRKLVSQLKTRD